MTRTLIKILKNKKKNKKFNCFLFFCAPCFYFMHTSISYPSRSLLFPGLAEYRPAPPKSRCREGEGERASPGLVNGPRGGGEGPRAARAAVGGSKARAAARAAETCGMRTRVRMEGGIRYVTCVYVQNVRVDFENSLFFGGRAFRN